MKSSSFEEMLANKVKQFSILVLLIVAPAVTMGTAEFQPLAPTQLDTVRILGLFPPLLPNNPEIEKCWSTLVDIEGCSAEILNFLFTFQLRLGPACCKAIIGLSETCLPAVFAWGSGWGRGISFNPAYPNVVKGYCASITGGKMSLPVHMSPPPLVHLESPSPASVEPPTTSVASAVTMGTTEFQPLAPTQLDTIRIPGLFPPLLPGPYSPEIEKCWSTLVDIEGCNAEILNFLFTFQLRLGPACCKAIIDLSETCLPAVFSSVSGWGIGIPFNPAYPNVIKSYCASITGVKQSPPSPFAVHMSPPPPPSPQAHRGAPKAAPVEPSP
ncbi:uncharacterized protein LOC113275181 [Papaver somniferum]|uniref:uncharacterized protein LOC113275181 n=1 Tax=Papaver somniferum TaxID=3469 RepID=UPI000E701FEC|nr:uncharacterized protein LOC113275181 [Papaver somniferum]